MCDTAAVSASVRPLICLSLVLALLLGACNGGNATSTPSPSATIALPAAIAAGLVSLPSPAVTSTSAPAATATTLPATPLPPTPAPVVETRVPPPAVPAAPPAAPTPEPLRPAAGPVSVTLRAYNLAFEPRSVTVASGASVTLILQNADTSVPHNLGVTVPGTEHTQDCAGPCVATLSFVAPASGSYVFYCNIHAGMDGTLTVR